MPRNFRLPAHRRANSEARHDSRVCAYCHRRLPHAAFVERRYVLRQGVVARDLQGPGGRMVQLERSECADCRRPASRLIYKVSLPWRAVSHRLLTPLQALARGLPWPPR